MTQKPYNSGDSASVNEARRDARSGELSFKNGIAMICDNRDTRIVLSRFLDEHGALSPAPVLKNPDPFEQGRAAGRHDAAMWFLQLMLLHDGSILGKMAQDVPPLTR